MSTAPLPLSNHQEKVSVTKPKTKNAKVQKKTVFLSEEERKKHHIESEHKRRQAIRDAFNKLVELVPELTPNDNRSEVLILNKSADYLNVLFKEQKSLVEQLEAKGLDIDEKLKTKESKD